MKLTLFVMTLALTLLVAAAANAQQPWSSIASGCVPDLASKSLIDAAHGTVTFGTGKSGHIKLSCPVQGVFNIHPQDVNDLVLTFYNDGGFVGGVNHCTIQADLLRSNLNNVEHGGDLAAISTSGQSYSGRHTLDRGLSEPLDFSTSFYWVDINLFRDSGSASCNPAVVGTYLNIVIP